MKKVKVGKSKIHGNGLFADEPIKRGDVIELVHTIRELEPGVIKTTPTLLGRNYNHSEDSNALNVVDGNNRYLVALKEIEVGGEITTDYRTNPDLEQPDSFTSNDNYISFDYDDTLTTPEGFKLAQQMNKEGKNLYVITARDKVTPQMIERAEAAGIPKENIITAGSDEAKVKIIKENNINKHIDNKDSVIKALGDKGELFVPDAYPDLKADFVEMDLSDDDLNKLKEGGFIIDQYPDGGESKNNRKFKERLMKRYPGMQGVYGAEGENLNIVKDPNYDASKYGYGDIEFIHPGSGLVTYSDDYQYQSPTPDKYTAVYNPKGANRGDVFLDMMHGMRDDPNYQPLLQNFEKAVRDARGGDMAWYYEDDVKNDGYTDGQEQWDENYIDSQLRAQLAPGSIGMFSKGRRDYRQERKYDSPEMRAAAEDIRNYLKGEYENGGELDTYPRGGGPGKGKKGKSKKVEPFVTSDPDEYAFRKAAFNDSLWLYQNNLKPLNNKGTISYGNSKKLLKKYDVITNKGSAKDLGRTYEKIAKNYPNKYDNVADENSPSPYENQTQLLAEKLGIDHPMTHYDHLDYSMGRFRDIGIPNPMTGKIIKTFDIPLRSDASRNWDLNIAARYKKPVQSVRFQAEPAVAKKPKVTQQKPIDKPEVIEPTPVPQPTPIPTPVMVNPELQKFVEERRPEPPGPPPGTGADVMPVYNTDELPMYATPDGGAEWIGDTERYVDWDGNRIPYRLPRFRKPGHGGDLIRRGKQRYIPFPSIESRYQAEIIPEEEFKKGGEPKKKKRKTDDYGRYRSEDGNVRTPLTPEMQAVMPPDEWGQYIQELPEVYTTRTKEQQEAMNAARNMEFLSKLRPKGPSYLYLPDGSLRPQAAQSADWVWQLGTLGAASGLGRSAIGAAESLGSRALPYIEGALNTSIPGMASIPGATIGNAAGAYFAGDAIVNRLYPSAGKIQEGKYGEAATDIATGLLDLYGANMLSPVYKGAKATVSELGKGLYEAGNAGVDLAKTNPQAWFKTPQQILETPDLYASAIGRTSWKDPVGKLNKFVDDAKMKSLYKRENALLDKYPGFENRNIRIPIQQEEQLKQLQIRKAIEERNLRRSKLPIKQVLTEQGTNLGGGQGRIFVNTLNPEEVIKIGTFPGNSNELAKLVETGKNLEGMPLMENVAFPTKAFSLDKEPLRNIYNNLNTTAVQFMPWKGNPLDVNNPINRGFGFGVPSDKAKRELKYMAELLDENKVGIDYFGQNNIIYDPKSDSYKLVDLNYVDDPKRAWEWNKLDKPVKQRIEDKFGYEIPKEVPKELPGSPNTFKSSLGSMDMSKYEIKNPDYFTQLLNTYDSRRLSNSNKQFYKDLIANVKKQNGIATERQYNELQRLRTGNFNFGKKGYSNGGPINLFENQRPNSKLDKFIR